MSGMTWKEKMERDTEYLLDLGWCPKCGSAPGRPCDCEKEEDKDERRK